MTRIKSLLSEKDSEAKLLIGLYNFWKIVYWPGIWIKLENFTPHFHRLYVQTIPLLKVVKAPRHTDFLVEWQYSCGTNFLNCKTISY